MTTGVSLEQAKAAVGFAALSIGKGHAALQEAGVSVEDTTLQAMTQAVSQWLRDRYSDAMIERAKTALGLSDAQQQDDADESVINAAQEACEMTLIQFFSPLPDSPARQQAFEMASQAMQRALLDAYGDVSPEASDTPAP